MSSPRITIGLLIIAANLLPLGGLNRALAQGAKNEELAAKARDVFKNKCLECHGDKKVAGGVKILERDLLISKDKVVPGSAEDSLLYQLITANDDTVMPPAGKPRLSAEEIAIVKDWIAAGAPPFPSGEVRGDADRPLGNEYVLRSILADVRRLSVADRKFARYFSIAHIWNSGATKEDLAIQRDALAKAINHLSWQPELVRPVPIEATRTVLRIDLRKLGWDKQPFRTVKNGKFVGNSTINIFDLALLEYPHGMISHKSETYLAIVRDFLSHAGQVRPIPYVRGDWFASVVTQPPLYEDFLQLPRTLKELETMLGVDSKANVDNFKAVRAGMVQSGVSRNNRVVERHETPNGYYWKSFDFKSSVGSQNILADPINFDYDGGEMIFSLPNGLQGYYVTDAKGNRITEAPTAIVVDAHASDRTVRNGLSCMRCHDRGMKTFADVVRPTFEKLGNASEAGMNVDSILKLYPEQSKLDVLVKKDEDRFMNAMEQLLGRPQEDEPLRPVSQRFLDQPLRLAEAGAELGLTETKKLKTALQSPQIIKEGFGALLADEHVHRGTWEKSFERVVRMLQIGVPLVTLDSLAATDYTPSAKAPFDLEVKTNKAGNNFVANEEIVIFIKPSKDVFIEVIGTSASGRKVILAPATTKVKAGQQFRFPPEGKTLKVKGNAGRELVTVLASEKAFSSGELLRGDNLADRVVHRLNVRSNGPNIEMDLSVNTFQMVMKTIAIESR